MHGWIASLVVAVPLAAAGLAYLASPAARTVLLVGTAVAHVAMTGALWTAALPGRTGAWFEADDLGLLVLTVTSLLFLSVAVYVIAFSRLEPPRGGRAFTSCLLVFLAAASLVCVSQHMALLWVGMEATTLAIAPLVYSRHDRRSLEAVWKYLVLSSVGIALALLAVFLLATAQPADTGTPPLVLGALLADGPLLDGWWLRAAFVFALIGFGTKMGLAPLHTWKPDIYGEAPGFIGALMAGSLTACAFLGLARFAQVTSAAGLDGFTQPLLIGAGIASLLVSTAFLIRPADVKRLLAYSSVEHMGLLVLGLGLGGVGTYGAVLHMINNALIKGALFLTVGNIVLAGGTSAVADLAGMRHVRPASAALLLVGLFAVTGSPPFGLFVSEFLMVAAAVREHHPLAAVILVTALATIFVGLAVVVVHVVYGSSRNERAAVPAGRESAPLVLAPALLTALVLMLGLYVPRALHDTIARVASSLGGGAP